jgi:DNA processing protein
MDDLFFILKLYRTENIGPISFNYLINKFKTAKNALENIDYFEDKWGKKIKIAANQEIEEELLKTEKFGAKIITYQDKLFPNTLKKQKDAAPLFTIAGNLDLLQKNMISIVGTRLPSLNGLKFCNYISSSLGKEGFVTVSGLAKGIDTEVHKSSMETGTIAVLAGGIDNIYPLENINFYHEIKERGLLVSDMKFGTVPSSKLFPKRNNIIAALGCATIVIESMAESGALITAERAFKLNKKVFAVPGHPYDEKYAGNNYLLQNGAKLVTKIDDVLSELNHVFDCCENLYFFEDFSSDEQKIIFNLLSYSPTSINELSQISQISINKILSILVEMEISNLVKLNPDNTAYKISGF